MAELLADSQVFSEMVPIVIDDALEQVPVDVFSWLAVPDHVVQERLRGQAVQPGIGQAE